MRLAGKPRMPFTCRSSTFNIHTFHAKQISQPSGIYSFSLFHYGQRPLIEVPHEDMMKHGLHGQRSRVHLPIEISDTILKNVTSQPASPLHQLSNELLLKIIDELSNPIDRSTLALTSKLLAGVYNTAKDQERRIARLAREAKRFRRPSPVTIFKKLEFLLRLHDEGRCRYAPGHRLCFTCATFKPVGEGWGGDTMLLCHRKVNDRMAIRGPRCKSPSVLRD